jgi:23S rRNA (adenine2503-C2)-methyltransferase
LRRWVSELGEPGYRGEQLARWIYRSGARRVQEMSDLPRAFRDRLAEVAAVGRSDVVRRRESKDGAVKLLLGLSDGRAVETVVLPYGDRTSVCISSQVGCPVGCTFCATATLGFARNLTAGEMVDQVLTAREHSPDGRVSHVVVMGEGEPLLNLDALLHALRLLHDEVGISYRRITVSTAGYVPGIRRLAEADLPVTLALSLHAPNDALRAPLIPLSRRWGVAAVMDAARSYAERTGRRVTLEYLLLAEVNDEPEHARELAGLVRDLVSHVNLIPWNPAETFSGFRTPGRRRIRAFRRELEAAGVTVTERVERGRDIAAACGQLAAEGASA